VQLDLVIAPLSTPFRSNGDINVQALQQNIAKYNADGLRGFVVAGSTGEAALLTSREKCQLFEAVGESARESVLIAGTATESLRETLELIRHAASLGYHAALVLTPHYYRAQMTRPDTQLCFYSSLADASPLPLLIYNFPQMTGIDLPVEVVAQLAQHPNILGIKESSADLDRVGKLIKTLPARFQVLVGASATYQQSLALNAKGGILAIANVMPRSALLIHERFRAGDTEGAHDLQKQIADRATVAPRFGIQGLKYAMDMNGYFGGESRLPLLPLTARQKREIELLFGTSPN
jgi:4-hydroxy-2-oxoglutarate aldolase